MNNPYLVGSIFKADGKLWIVLWSRPVGDRGISVAGAPVEYSWNKDYWQLFFFPSIPSLCKGKG